MTTTVLTRRRKNTTSRRRLDHPVDQYAKSIKTKSANVGKYHRLAGLRHLRDRGVEGTAKFPYVFNAELADDAIRFFEQMRHYKGPKAGQRLTLERWQQFVIGSLFGWVHQKTGYRRFRTCYEEIPRKNGKSIKCAAGTIKFAFFDGEMGADVYVAATKKDQAKIVFEDARQLVLRNPFLKKRFKVLANNIHQQTTASKIEPLGADRDTLDGLNPYAAVIDEFHAHKLRAVLDVIATAMGARVDPVLWLITTAGSDPHSPCGEMHTYATKVLERLPDFEDETFFTFITHADPIDDPFSEKTWEKANPNLDVSVSREDMRALSRRARGVPSELATFKQKRLNIWISAGTPWLDLEAWRAGQTTWRLEDQQGRACIGGLDLSSKIAMTAFVLLWPPDDQVDRWLCRAWFFMAEGNVAELARKHRAPYQEWVDNGLIQTTEGKRIQHPAIVAQIQELRESGYAFDAVGYDPWNCGNIPNDLDAAGIEAVEVGQKIGQLNEACKDFESYVKDGRFDAGGDPVFEWMASNVTVRRDGDDNIKIARPKDGAARTDGISAAVTGLRAYRALEGENEASDAFESRGLL